MKKGTFIFFLLILCLIVPEGCAGSSQPSVLRVALPYSDYVIDPETNYYVNWLEEKTGVEIEPVIIRMRDGEEYLDVLFSGDFDIDIVMFGGDFTIESSQLERFADAGLLYKNDAGRYYYENRGRSSVSDCGQTFWINSDWLTKLNLSIPTDTAELKTVLKAFKESDANGNGKADEIPLLGSTDGYAYNPVEFILNSYVYNDPYNLRQYVDDAGKVRFAPSEPGFSEGLSYVRDLYAEGLLDERTFYYPLSAFSEAVNSNADIVGAFTTDSIADVVYRSNPEIMAKYIHVAPLKGPSGEKNALYVNRDNEVGAIICADSDKTDEAVRLLNTMMTEEASLIARYGEEGVDWDYSDGLDVSIYGLKSTIVTKNYIWDTPQNKHLNGIGPMNLSDEYVKGVTWNGINSDSEYIDARAQMSYAPYLPGEDKRLDGRYDKALSDEIDTAVYDYIKTGNESYLEKIRNGFKATE